MFLLSTFKNTFTVLLPVLLFPHGWLTLVDHFVLQSQCSCILEFDGASKGNPGPAGAGAVLRAIDGSLVHTQNTTQLFM